MNDRRILVTGGAGYIGSHTAKALAAAGYEPVVFDDLSNGHAEAVKWGPLVRGDVRNQGAVEACIREYGISAVIQFAGLIEVGRSVLEPDAFWDTNLNGVASVLGAMRACGVRRIVFSSTAAVYGQPEGELLAPLKETLPLQPINPYGDSKLAAERLIAAHARAYGIEGVALRYFNAAGADPDGEIGEAHSPESHLIPLAIEAALGLGSPLTVFGQDFPTPDGACVRDYIHVADLAQAHVLALAADVGPAGFVAMNLGLGRGVSVLEVIAAVDRVTGRTTPFAVGPRRAGDPAVLVADPGAARERLGWEPSFASLDDIVRTAAAWRLKPRFGRRLVSEPALQVA
ncbi:MAG TPA: UDP-glucose 4-epimerase GalE [Brevundimonas sp.]|jgi:UDP-glucose 4-epimerase/UDP-arabinose 4-epimerase|uniref:UDP-glucose 4-epimerase GalE n=1 Tax=Brevundimonas sp. TaxID=1871086 RepID=UPI002ED8B209